VYAQFRSGSILPPRLDHAPDHDDCRDELAIFGGQTRVLVSKLLLTKSPDWGTVSAGPTTEVIPSPVTKSEAEVQKPSGFPDRKMEDVHPSLVEYMSLFPPSAFSPGFNAYPNFSAQQPMMDLSIMSEVSALQPSTVGAELSDYPYLQPSLPRRQSQPQYMSIGSMDPVAPPNVFPYDSSSTSSFDTFKDSQAYPMSTSTAASTPETSGSGDLTDLGLMMTGESGMDEQWMSFMRDSGILNRSTG
jgi:hypothetical protein